MFSFFKHTRHYWVPYASPSAVSWKQEDTKNQSIIYTEKCYGCGKMRTITIEPEQPPVIRESDEH